MRTTLFLMLALSIAPACAVERSDSYAADETGGMKCLDVDHGEFTCDAPGEYFEVHTGDSTCAQCLCGSACVYVECLQAKYEC